MNQDVECCEQGECFERVLEGIPRIDPRRGGESKDGGGRQGNLLRKPELQTEQEHQDTYQRHNYLVEERDEEDRDCPTHWPKSMPPSSRLTSGELAWSTALPRT